MFIVSSCTFQFTSLSEFKEIYSHLVLIVSFRFLEEYKVVNSRNQCPPEYGTASSVVTDDLS